LREIINRLIAGEFNHDTGEFVIMYSTAKLEVIDDLNNVEQEQMTKSSFMEESGVTSSKSFCYLLMSK